MKIKLKIAAFLTKKLGIYSPSLQAKKGAEMGFEMAAQKWKEMGLIKGGTSDGNNKR